MFVALTGDECILRRVLLFELAGNPVVRDLQSIFERDRRLPLQHFAQTRVVAVATANALGLRDVVAFADALARDLRDDVYKLVDRDHPILPEVDRLSMMALHQAIDTFDTIVDVAVGTRLLSVAPH